MGKRKTRKAGGGKMVNERVGDRKKGRERWEREEKGKWIKDKRKREMEMREMEVEKRGKGEGNGKG